MTKSIARYFNELTSEQIQLFDQLPELYTFWNNQINVISRKDIDALEEKHILHSLAIAKFIHFLPETKIIDVGTGGGFPGIPLAIFFPKVEFLLIDSIGKKIKVVNEVIKALGLTNVRAKQVRSNELKQQFDFVVSRAVTAFPKFVADTQHLISPTDKNAIPNGIIYLKGGDFTEEISTFPHVDLVDIPDFFEEDFFETKKIIYLPMS